MFLVYLTKSRIEHYGLTELRYFALIICSWGLISIAWFYLARTRFQWQTIPRILATLCILASVGFWQIGKLPMALQFDALEKFLIAEKLLVNGHYQAPTITNHPGIEVRKTIYNKLNYLITGDNREKLRAWFIDKQAFDAAISCNITLVCLPQMGDGIFNLMQLHSLKVLDPFANREELLYMVASAFEKEHLQPSPLSATYTDFSGSLTSATGNYLFNAPEYDYVIEYNNTCQNRTDGIFDITLDLQTNKREIIRLVYEDTGMLTIFIGQPAPFDSDNFNKMILEHERNSTEFEDHPNYDRYAKVEEKLKEQERQTLINSPFDKNTVKSIRFDLKSFFEQIFTQYSDTLKLDSLVYNQNPPKLSLDKNGLNSLRLEKTENALAVKIEMSEFCVKTEINSHEKQPMGFSGRIYLKKLN